MLSKIISILHQDLLYRIFAFFIATFIVYLIAMQVYIYFFKKQNNVKALNYKYFRIYTKDLIKNTPSKTAKRFYKNANKLTAFFNTLMIVSFVLFLYKMFGFPFI